MQAEKVCPHSGEKFIPKRKNQVFATSKNRRDYHNQIASKKRENEKKLKEPKTDEEKKAFDEAYKISLLFRMVNLNVEVDVAWLINESIKMYQEKGVDFSIHDAAKLIVSKDKLFKN